MVISKLYIMNNYRDILNYYYYTMYDDMILIDELKKIKKRLNE